MERTTAQKAGIILVVICAALLVLVPVTMWVRPPVVNLNTLDSQDHNRVQVHLQLHPDGSATVTEDWSLISSSVFTSASFEYGLSKRNLGDMKILGLQVTQTYPTEKQYVVVDQWDSGVGLYQRLGSAALIPTPEGYEIRWGTNGTGTYRLRYTLTNLVKGYDGGAALHYSYGDLRDGSARSIELTVAADSFAPTPPNVRVWAMGIRGTASYVDGQMTISAPDGPFSEQATGVLMAFEDGLFTLSTVSGQSVDDAILLGLEGSIWESRWRTEVPKAMDPGKIDTRKSQRNYRLFRSTLLLGAVGVRLLMEIYRRHKARKRMSYV